MRRYTACSRLAAIAIVGGLCACSTLSTPTASEAGSDSAIMADSAGDDPCRWRLEDIEGAPHGISFDLALESQRQPLVVYTTSHTIRLARRERDKWATLWQSPAPHDVEQVAVTSVAGGLRLAYVARDKSKRLRLHEVNGSPGSGSFAQTTHPVFPEGTTCPCRLRFDVHGGMHLTHVDLNASKSRDGYAYAYTTNRDGAWETRTVPGAANGLNHDLAVDANQRAHVAFSEKNVYLSYATDAAGPWRRERVIQQSPNLTPAIAVGPDGAVHLVVSVSYYPRIWPLTHLTRGAGGWQKTVVDPDSEASPPSITVGADGPVIVALHRDHVFHNMPSLYWAAADGWRRRSIDRKGLPQVRPRIIVDADSRPHYLYATHGGLAYATKHCPLDESDQTVAHP